jgi:hypothetical protein
MKKILILLSFAGLMAAQQQVTLTTVAPPAVQSLGAGVVGTAGTVSGCYWVVVNYVGGSVLSAAPICLTNIPGTLSSSNYVQIGWAAATGTSVTYDVLKTTTRTPPVAGASTALATGLTVTTSNDQGGSLSPYTIAGYPYATGSGLLFLNNRDFVYPAMECTGTVSSPCQASFGIIVPKGSPPTAGVIRLGSYTTPFTIDKNGATYMTSGPGVPGGVTGTITAGNIFSVSANLTLAQVNAGTIIYQPVVGQTLKVNHVSIQAIGGAAAACTLVEVTDTATVPIVAMSATVAGLTQNTRVTESSAATVAVTTAFAPTALTANQGIQVIQTGSACTTATSFNIVVDFTINS